MPSRPRFDLFLVSGLILFLELACIRWFPSHVLFLTFFTNTVLLACFVGMSVGCLTARSGTSHLRRTPLLLLIAMGVGLGLDAARPWLERSVDLGNQAKPDVVFFGAEAGSQGSADFRVPVELIAGGMFLLIAAVLVGPGQELGRAFNRVPDRVTGYSLNIAGSLAGIGLFAAGSYLHLPPPVWFAACAAGVLYLLNRSGSLLGPAVALAGCLALTLPTSGLIPGAADATGTSPFHKPAPDGTPPATTTAWSPYYRVDYNPHTKEIVTNLIGHQTMSGKATTKDLAYDLPHALARQSGRPQPKRILIIGAGSGNDVSRALQWGGPDATVDAVDIEPVIQAIGRADHPDQPYRDPRVTRHLDDGRNFLRRAAAGQYDLVVYALVDSLVLHSSYGSIRLESFLFTRPAFADIKRVLKPDGTFAVYNFFRHGFLVARLNDALRDTFGAEPVCLTDPPADRVAVDEAQNAAGPGTFTLFLAGSDAAVGPVRAAFAAAGNRFWVSSSTVVGPDTDTWRFSPNPPPAATGPGEDGQPTAVSWGAFRVAEVGDSGGLPPATDEWPFFYTRQPTLPGYILRGAALTLLLSAVLWSLFKPADWAPATGENGLLARMFFLGAGFMLMETKAVVHMALLFGSTWMVNTVVFFAILVVALLANLFVLAVRPKSVAWAHVGLFLALGANVAVPLDAFLGLPPVLRTAAACGLVFAPIGFAGVVFAVSFGRSRHPDRAIGANVAGALVGGLAENLSMLLGFQLLLLVAAGFYAGSAMCGRAASRPRQGTEDAPGDDAIAHDGVTAAP